MSPQTMVDEKARLNDADSNSRDDLIREDLEQSMPHNMEKAWRLMDMARYRMGIEYKDPKKVLEKKFDPLYQACPWPVKKNPSGDWRTGNVERCNHEIPADLPPLERQAMAEIHCRAHLDYFFEYYGTRGKNGELRPPASTKINVPMWADDDIPGDDPSAPNRERVRMRVEAKLKTERQVKNADRQEIVEKINEFNAEKSPRGRGR